MEIVLGNSLVPLLNIPASSTGLNEYEDINPSNPPPGPLIILANCILTKGGLDIYLAVSTGSVVAAALLAFLLGTWDTLLYPGYKNVASLPHLRRFLFEQINEDTNILIENEIVDTFEKWLPFVEIRELDVNTQPINSDRNQIKIKVTFNIRRAPGSLESVGVVLG